MTKTVSLALQGGGAHGAFTWGVLDRLLEDERVEISAISGTSAGAMNAVVMTNGIMDSGRDGAKQHLETFWRAVSDAARFSPIQRSALDKLMGNWNMDMSPAYLYTTAVSGIFSPTVFNPLQINPLRDIVLEQVDFDQVTRCDSVDLYIAATNVETGLVRVFDRDEINVDVVMASACLPDLFEAVEIDGVPYWDGGYAGNPPLFPFFGCRESDDIVIVQLNPIERSGAPKSANEIRNRINEITFNQSLLKELRAIEFVHRLLEKGALDRADYRDMNVHVIENQQKLRPLGASSKMNAEWRFLQHLRDIGRETAENWLAEHYQSLGQRSTVDLQAMFAGVSNGAREF